MITTYENYSMKESHYDMYGLSSDTKPTDVPNASTFYEMDTKTLFMFDAENRVWLDQ